MAAFAAQADQPTVPALEVRRAVIPGRARFVSPKLYRAAAPIALLERRLVRHQHIRLARGNPLTGSLLVQFAPDRSVDEVGKLVRDELTRSFEPGTMERARIGRPAVPAIDRRPVALRDTTTEWYRRSAEDVCRSLGTDAVQGLTELAAAQRLARYGPNELPVPAQPSLVEHFMAQLKSGPVAMLGAAAALAIATGGAADAAAIAAVVLINAAIGCFTERQSDRIISGLAGQDAGTVRVVREGVARDLPADALVPGDLVRLRADSPVPADLRLVSSDGLLVNESLLTGESASVAKSVEPLDQPQLLADRRNMVYRDTRVFAGSGSGVVVATGLATEVGGIHELIGQARPPPTPMQRQLDRIGNQLIWLSGGICIGIFLIGWLRGYGVLPMLSRAVSLAVAALPEGLPTVATTTLALGVRQMRSRHAVARSLNAVETLGACNVVCLDKTGTLTENRLCAAEVCTADRRYELDDATPAGKAELADSAVCRLLGQTLALCVENGGDGVHGSGAASPTESALLDFSRSTGADSEDLRRSRLLGVEHRTEDRPYLVTRHTIGDRWFACVKGSPESVLALCSSVLVGGKIRFLDRALRKRLRRENKHMAGKGQRVLAVARAPARARGRQAKFTWLGLVGLRDPIRAGAREVMARLHRAGIRTIMITGDQKHTARAIARRLQLAGPEPLRVIDAGRGGVLEEDELAHAHVFSRVAPSQKSGIVRALQNAGCVVAMTGDGINDGPALKAADIGVSLGANGTETARLASGLVLEDDNLGTLIFAVQQGRTIYGNIRKSIRYLLSTNLSEIEVMLAAVILDLGQVLSPMQLLWINLATDIAPGLALAMEPPNPGSLDAPPRDPAASIIGSEDFRELALESTFISAGALASYLYGLRRYGKGTTAGCLCFLTLVLGQLVHTWSCRSEQSLLKRGTLPPNRYIVPAVAGAFALLGAAACVPALRRLLGLTRVGVIDGAVVLVGGLGPLLANEVRKLRR